MSNLLPHERAVTAAREAAEAYVNVLRKLERDPFSDVNIRAVERAYSKASAAQWELQQTANMPPVAPLTRRAVRAHLVSQQRANYGECTAEDRKTIGQYIDEAEDDGAKWGVAPYTTLEVIASDYRKYVTALTDIERSKSHDQH